jgi:hypothetical protein
MQHKEMAKQFPTFDPRVSEAEAVRAQSQLKPGFSIENDRFQRSWTNLDLGSMVKRRDALAAKYPKPFELGLEPLYIGVYKTASSVIHSDATSLSYQFLDIIGLPGEKPVLMCPPYWAQIVAVNLSLCDVLQCYETLARLDIMDAEKVADVMNEWHEVSKKHR